MRIARLSNMAGLVAAALASGCATGNGGGGALDFDGRSVTAVDRTGLGLAEDEAGVVVQRVGDAASPLSVGDTILAVNGAEIRSPAEIVNLTYDIGASREISLTVVRDGVRMERRATTGIGERKGLFGFGLPVNRPPLDTEVGALALDNVIDAEFGPDESGFMLFRLLGYESGPRGWDLRLLLVQFGSHVEYVAPDGAAAAAAEQAH